MAEGILRLIYFYCVRFYGLSSDVVFSPRVAEHIARKNMAVNVSYEFRTRHIVEWKPLKFFNFSEERFRKLLRTLLNQSRVFIVYAKNMLFFIFFLFTLYNIVLFGLLQNQRSIDRCNYNSRVKLVYYTPIMRNFSLFAILKSRRF